jgi:hypothetical protein
MGQSFESFENEGIHEGPNSYEVLIKHYWYNPKHHKIAKAVGIEMEREANLAFSALYRLHTIGERDFVKFAWMLAGSSHPGDRRNAVFIMKHTEWTEGFDKVRVGREFHPILEKLFMDADIATTVNKNIGMFSVNLSDFSKRKEMRENLIRVRTGGQNSARRTGRSRPEKQGELRAASEQTSDTMRREGKATLSCSVCCGG